MKLIELTVADLLQDPTHRIMCGDPIETGKDLSSLEAAYNRMEKLLPILFIVVMEGNIEKLYVIDGWSSVLTYRAKGIKTITGIKVDLENPVELPYLLADLHTNYHNSPEEDFKKFTYFANLLGLGQGHRSDLKEDKAFADGEKKRNAAIYEKIGKLFGKSSSYVKHILKIGRVNPEYFERITNGKFSVFGAYSACIAEARGDIPPVPKVKTPVYYTNSTEVPVFTTFGSTDESNEGSAEESTNETPSTPTPPTKSIQANATDLIKAGAAETEYILVTGICEKCGEVTTVKINKNQIK